VRIWFCLQTLFLRSACYQRDFAAQSICDKLSPTPIYDIFSPDCKTVIANSFFWFHLLR
jgi:hypothetical protein